MHIFVYRLFCFWLDLSNNILSLTCIRFYRTPLELAFKIQGDVNNKRLRIEYFQFLAFCKSDWQLLRLPKSDLCFVFLNTLFV